MQEQLLIKFGLIIVFSVISSFAWLGIRNITRIVTIIPLEAVSLEAYYATIVATFETVIDSFKIEKYSEDNSFMNLLVRLIMPAIILLIASTVIALGYLTGWCSAMVARQSLNLFEIVYSTIIFLFLILKLTDMEYLTINELFAQIEIMAKHGWNKIDWIALNNDVSPFLINGLLFFIGLSIAS